jgi:uncharacterized protein YecE (DUF72 family)
MTVYAGTSGYAYKEWKGSFYPAKIRTDDMLSYYGSQFAAVEINNTFYRMPTDTTVERWATQVPEEFRFVLKASQRITHHRRLREAEDLLSYFVTTARTLGPRLGALLFQLPPNFKADLPRLEAFLALLPEEVRVAFEFRHASWHDESVVDLLRTRGVALCIADGEKLEPFRVASAAFGYLRLRGEGYDDSELQDWADWVAAQGWTDTYVFFKHEDGAAGPALARRFLELAARR